MTPQILALFSLLSIIIIIGVGSLFLNYLSKKRRIKESLENEIFISRMLDINNYRKQTNSLRYRWIAPSNYIYSAKFFKQEDMEKDLENFVENYRANHLPYKDI